MQHFCIQFIKDAIFSTYSLKGSEYIGQVKAGEVWESK